MMMAIGHWGIFSYGFGSPLKWVIMQGWASGRSRPARHIRGWVFPSADVQPGGAVDVKFTGILTTLHKHQQVPLQTKTPGKI